MPLLWFASNFESKISKKFGCSPVVNTIPASHEDNLQAIQEAQKFLQEKAQGKILPKLEISLLRRVDFNNTSFKREFSDGNTTHLFGRKDALNNACVRSRKLYKKGEVLTSGQKNLLETCFRA